MHGFSVSVAVQLFPYHLADYVCRVLRVTPFRYYCDLLFTVMREEKSYDQIPNFTVSPHTQPAHYSYVDYSLAGQLDFTAAKPWWGEIEGYLCCSCWSSN